MNLERSVFVIIFIYIIFSIVYRMLLKGFGADVSNSLLQIPRLIVYAVSFFIILTLMAFYTIKLADNFYLSFGQMVVVVIIMCVQGKVLQSHFVKERALSKIKKRKEEETKYW